MAYCFGKLEKYENGIICYKYMLALAWTCKSLEAEHCAYEGLATMHLYLGNIEKVRFYDARVTHVVRGCRHHLCTKQHAYSWRRR